MLNNEIDIQQSNKSATVKYKKIVYYDESGNIEQIVSNKISNNSDFIEVDTSEVIDVLLGIKSTTDFLVKYDQAIQKYILSPKTNNKSILKNNEYFYEISKKEIDYQDLEDLCVIQNNKNNTWIFKRAKNSKIELLKNNNNLNIFLDFSITAKEDPNRLYRFFKIKLRDLVEKTTVTFDFQYKTEFNNEEVSIYTSKYFNTYSFEVI